MSDRLAAEAEFARAYVELDVSGIVKQPITNFLTQKEYRGIVVANTAHTDPTKVSLLPNAVVGVTLPAQGNMTAVAYKVALNTFSNADYWDRIYDDQRSELTQKIRKVHPTGFVVVEFMTHVPVDIQNAPPIDPKVTKANKQFVTWTFSSDCRIRPCSSGTTPSSPSSRGNTITPSRWQPGTVRRCKSLRPSPRSHARPTLPRSRSTIFSALAGLSRARQRRSASVREWKTERGSTRSAVSAGPSLAAERLRPWRRRPRAICRGWCRAGRICVRSWHLARTLAPNATQWRGSGSRTGRRAAGYWVALARAGLHVARVDRAGRAEPWQPRFNSDLFCAG